MNRRSLLRSALSIAALAGMGLGWKAKAPKVCDDAARHGTYRYVITYYSHKDGKHSAVCSVPCVEVRHFNANVVFGAPS